MLGMTNLGLGMQEQLSGSQLVDGLELTS
jgi:hypothetical protein